MLLTSRLAHFCTPYATGTQPPEYTSANGGGSFEDAGLLAQPAWPLDSLISSPHSTLCLACATPLPYVPSYFPAWKLTVFLNLTWAIGHSENLGKDENPSSPNAQIILFQGIWV